MRITIITIGTRGDVQPCIALGCGLQASGHSVRLATQSDFEPLVRGYGLDFRPIGGSMAEKLRLASVQRILSKGDGSLRFGRFARRSAARVGPLIQEVMAECWAACQDADVVLSAHLSGIFGASVAEKLRAPHIALHLFPLYATAAFPNVFCPSLPAWLSAGQGYYNQLTYTLAKALFWTPLRSALSQARQQILQLPPLKAHTPHPILCGYSPTVLPKPNDWPEWVDVTGYWFLDRPADWRPPTELVDFLQAGPPPVYIGCGSMVGARRETMLDLAQEALRQTGQRGLIVREGIEAPEMAGDNMLQIGAVPHDWLFPRVAAVIHHGGAGTTGAVLNAGAPSLIIPFIADQPFWGRQIQRLGVGIGPISPQTLTGQRLAEAIARVTGDSEIRRRALAIGARVRAEDGVARAVKVIHQHVANADIPASPLQLRALSTNQRI
jgi:UDP:flavonoid glycosyltransferase YjiC (YdhE family)